MFINSPIIIGIIFITQDYALYLYNIMYILKSFTVFKHTLYRHSLPSNIFFINQNFKSHPATSKTTSKGYPFKPVQVLVRCRILLSDRFVHLIYPVTELISNILFFNRTLHVFGDLMHYYRDPGEIILYAYNTFYIV